MKTCAACQTPNADDSHLCVGCQAPLTDIAVDAEIERLTRAGAARKRRNRALGSAAGVALVGLIAFNVVSGARKKKLAEATAAFYTDYRGIDETTVSEFWKCTVRGQAARAVEAMENNLELYAALDKAIGKGPKGYVTQLRDLCLPKLLAAPAKLRALATPPEVKPALDGYAASLETLAKGAQKFDEELAAIADQAELDKQMLDLANNYHYADDDGPKTYAYDNFLRCAIPGLDQKDMQGVVEALAVVFKEPTVEVARWRKECMPPLADAEHAKPAPGYKPNLAKFSQEGREMDAFRDIFKKADKARRDSLLDPMGQVWLQFINARTGLLQSIKSVMGDVKG